MSPAPSPASASTRARPTRARTSAASGPAPARSLASATFTNETASGWQQVTFATPVAITANTTYVASYHTNVGHYAEDDNYFTSGVDSGPLHALADGASGPNGVYAYGSTSTFPNNGYQASNYWVDVAFSSGTSTTPAVTVTSPTSNATNVATNTAVTATFNEAMNPATISTSTFTLTDPNNTSVPGSVTYTDTPSHTATFTPTSPLANSTTYTATIVGGTGGVKDASGNAMAANYTWSFTTAAPIGSGPYSIWNPADVPGIPFVSDSAVEVGVKFTSDVAGTITGIRFYKGTGNTGTHVGHLWSSNGTLLASATFSGETASGWQQVLFTTPVTIPPTPSTWPRTTATQAMPRTTTTSPPSTATCRCMPWPMAGRAAPTASTGTAQAAASPPPATCRRTTGSMSSSAPPEHHGQRARRHVERSDGPDNDQRKEALSCSSTPQPPGYRLRSHTVPGRTGTS